MVTPPRPHRVRQLLAQSATAQHPWASARVVALRACAPTPSKGAPRPQCSPPPPDSSRSACSCAACLRVLSHVPVCCPAAPERRAQPAGRMPSTPSGGLQVGGRQIRQLTGHTSAVVCVSVGAADGSGRSGTLLATASHDKTVRVWVVDDERGSQAAATVLRAHSRPVQLVVFSPSGRLLLSGAHDGTLRLWDMKGAS
jgi:WD40 repeat protein